MSDRHQDRVNALRQMSRETEWVEFKVSNGDPHMIGRTVFTLANSASLQDQPLAWLVWGVDDSTLDIVGTDFDPWAAKVGNQPLELWLAQRLRPDCPCRMDRVEMGSKVVVLMEIPKAVRVPTTFEGVAYVRIGSTTPKLSDYSEREGKLWQKLVDDHHPRAASPCGPTLST